MATVVENLLSGWRDTDRHVLYVAAHNVADALMTAQRALLVAERAMIDGIEAETGREFQESDATRPLHQVRAALIKLKGE